MEVNERKGDGLRVSVGTRRIGRRFMFSLFRCVRDVECGRY
jgi:hypothetical protein